MRILLVHSFYRSVLPSGENDVVLAQASLMKQHGYEVEIWGPTSPDDAGILYKVRTALEVSVGRGRQPQDLIKSFRPDLIHVHNLFPNISTRWLRVTHVPVAMTLHNYRAICANGVLTRNARACLECTEGSAKPAVVHKCYRDSRIATLSVIGFQQHIRTAIASHVDALIFTSELSEKLLSPRVRHGYSVVIPNFVRESTPPPQADTANSDPYFLVVGRLTSEKGVAELLSIWPSGYRLVVVGDGPQREHLERLAATSPVQFRGFVDEPVRDQLLKGASALVLPSITFEADPLVVPQALSAGTPCVVKAGTASAELANSSQAIRSYHGAESLRDALNATLQQDQGIAARELYERRWSPEAWLQSYEHRVIRHLVNNVNGG